MQELLRGTALKMTLEEEAGRRTAYLRVRFIMVSEEQIKALTDLIGQPARTVVRFDD